MFLLVLVRVRDQNHCRDVANSLYLGHADGKQTKRQDLYRAWVNEEETHPRCDRSKRKSDQPPGNVRVSKQRAQGRATDGSPDPYTHDFRKGKQPREGHHLW